MTEIFTAKTVDEAKDLAAKKFGKDIKEIRFEIIEEGKKGIFGIGAKDAKVKATIASSAAAKTAAAPERSQKSCKKAARGCSAAEPAPVKKAAPVVTETPAAAPEKAEKPAETAPEVKDDDEDYSLDKFTLIEDESSYRIPR